MAYSHRQVIAAADLSSLDTSANAIWGTGTGDRGYGQTTLSAPTAGIPVDLGYSNLRTVLASMCSWQNTATTLLPSSGSVARGASIVAFPTGETPSFPDLVALVDTNRLNYQIGNMTLASSVASTTRSTTWTSFIQAGFSIQFADENAARYFFNTGGELRLALSHPSTASSQDTDWHNMLDNSNIAFRAHSTAKLSGNGTGSSIGYYELTTDWQAVFTINGTGAYSANSMVVYARADAIPGVNGAKGSLIYLYANFNESHTNAFYDLAQAGTVATLSHLRAGAVLSNLPAAPTCSVAGAFG
jgi:hypothetical protein